VFGLKADRRRLPAQCLVVIAPLPQITQADAVGSESAQALLRRAWPRARSRSLHPRRLSHSLGWTSSGSPRVRMVRASQGFGSEAGFLHLFGFTQCVDHGKGKQAGLPAIRLVVVSSATVYHSDEGMNVGHKGSARRRQEAQYKASARSYAMWAVAHCPILFLLSKRR
jgi:hypothetical protein